MSEKNDESPSQILYFLEKMLKVMQSIDDRLEDLKYITGAVAMQKQ